MIKAKRSLGQNFLIDKNIIEQITNIVKIENKNILEVGPGTGNLTSAILNKKPNKLIVIEKDEDLVNYLKKKYNRSEIFFLMGADNLINFHKWYKWKSISSKCNILVFDRKNYKSKSLKSKAFKKLNSKGLTFVKFKKVNISSSKLRKI